MAVVVGTFQQEAAGKDIAQFQINIDRRECVRKKFPGGGLKGIHMVGDVGFHK